MKSVLECTKWIPLFGGMENIPTQKVCLCTYVGGSIRQIVVYCDKCMSKTYLVLLKHIHLVHVHQLSHHWKVAIE